MNARIDIGGQKTAPLKNIGVRCTDETHRRFRVLAAQRGASLGETLAYLLDQHDAQLLSTQEPEQ